jgi:hypothetical protein
MDVCAVFHVVLSRKKKGEERVGVGGRGKYPGAPPHIKRKKRKKARPQGTVKRESLLKKKKKRTIQGDQELFGNTEYVLVNLFESLKRRVNLCLEQNRGYFENFL